MIKLPFSEYLEFEEMTPNFHLNNVEYNTNVFGFQNIFEQKVLTSLESNLV